MGLTRQSARDPVKWSISENAKISYEIDLHFRYLLWRRIELMTIEAILFFIFWLIRNIIQFYFFSGETIASLAECSLDGALWSFLSVIKSFFCIGLWQWMKQESTWTKLAISWVEATANIILGYWLLENMKAGIGEKTTSHGKAKRLLHKDNESCHKSLLFHPPYSSNLAPGYS